MMACWSVDLLLKTKPSEAELTAMGTMTKRFCVVTCMNHKVQGGKSPISQAVNICSSTVQDIITFIHLVIRSEPWIFNNTLDGFVGKVVREKHQVEAKPAHRAAALAACVMKGVTACVALSSSELCWSIKVLVETCSISARTAWWQLSKHEGGEKLVALNANDFHIFIWALSAWVKSAQWWGNMCTHSFGSFTCWR